MLFKRTKSGFVFKVKTEDKLAEPLVAGSRRLYLFRVFRCVLDLVHRDVVDEIAFLLFFRLMHVTLDLASPMLTHLYFNSGVAFHALGCNTAHAFHLYAIAGSEFLCEIFIRLR